MGNEKPARIAFIVGVLGILAAVRDTIKGKDSKLPIAGLILNLLAILGAVILLPYM